MNSCPTVFSFLVKSSFLAFFSDPEPVQTTPSNNVGIIAGVLGALVLIVIVIIAVLLYKKYYILLLFAVNINCRKIINHIILYNTWRY